MRSLCQALAGTDAVVSDAATVKAAFFAVSGAMLIKLVASQTPPIVRCSEQRLSTHSSTHASAWSLLVKHTVTVTSGPLP